MPTAKPTTKIHETLPPVNRSMRLDLFVDTPFGPSDLCSIDAYIHQYDDGLEHNWTGRLKVDGEVMGTRGSIVVELPSPDRGGAPRRVARDVAVFLAFKYFEALGCLRPRERVFELWQKRRAESLHALAARFQAGAICVEKELPMKLGASKSTHNGITDVSKVSAVCTRAKKLLDPTMLKVIGATTPFRDADGWTIGDVGVDAIFLAKGTRMILREKGSRICRVEGASGRCVVHGPLWVWAMGDEVAVHVLEGHGVNINLDADVPPNWFD